jgi:hypothetical protein
MRSRAYRRHQLERMKRPIGDPLLLDESASVEQNMASGRS